MQKIFVSLELKHNTFLLARNHPGEDREAQRELVDVSNDMMDLVLDMWSQRDMLVDFQWQFNGMVSPFRRNLYGNTVDNDPDLCVRYFECGRFSHGTVAAVPRLFRRIAAG